MVVFMSPGPAGMNINVPENQIQDTNIRPRMDTTGKINTAF